MRIHQNETIAFAAPEGIQKSGCGKTERFKTMFQQKLAIGKNNPSPKSADSALADTAATHRVCLGTISAQAPTVSHLLYQSVYKQDCWNILADDVNANKPFTRIRAGTSIYLDTRSSEIIWAESLPKSVDGIHNAHSAAGVGAENKCKGTSEGKRVDASLPDTKEPTEALPRQLDRSVTGFIGTSYDRMDCFELLVAGLERIGVQYRGRHGLAQHLANQARRNGLDKYSLYSGEGVTQEIGKNVFKEAIPVVKQANGEAEAALRRMRKVLHEGQILSFSTPTRGHTGVISRKMGVWTFINSGEMDNNLSGQNDRQAVGEEDLREELKNWFRRAHKEGGGLTITLGALDSVKLAQFQPRAAGAVHRQV